MTNRPTYADFIAEKAGTRDWYTRSHAAPTKARGKLYLSPKRYAAIRAEYEALFGAAW